MIEFILFMHNDTVEKIPESAWPTYFTMLQERGAFEGGSSIGSGEVVRKDKIAGRSSDHLTGYIRVQAENMAAARLLVDDNPVFVAGGSVEIRELTRD